MHLLLDSTEAKINYAFINFDDDRLANIRIDDLNTVLTCLYRIYGDFEYLFLDEVQNVDGWHLFVNRLLRQGVHLVVTGSNAKLLSADRAVQRDTALSILVCGVL